MEILFIIYGIMIGFLGAYFYFDYQDMKRQKDVLEKIEERINYIAEKIRDNKKSISK